MSRAFTKEDPEIHEREGRKRSSSGLPPGAANYLTAQGAEHFRRELQELEARARRENLDRAGSERLATLQELLDHATIVPRRQLASAEVLFGTIVTIRTSDGGLTRHRIVGVDEAEFDPASISWCSAVGKSLLGATPGQRLQLPDGTKVEIVEISPD